MSQQLSMSMFASKAAFEQAKQAQDAEQKPVYCYSFCEELYRGHFDSFGEALAAAQGEAEDHESVWIAEHRHPTEWIKPDRLGMFLEEHITEALGDEIGEAAELFSLTADQYIELGQLVLDWINAGPKFNCFGVKNVKEVSLVEDRDTQTADLFEGGAA